MALCAGPYARGTPVETLLGGTHPCYPSVRQWALVHPDQRWLAARHRMTRGASGHDARHPWSWYTAANMLWADAVMASARWPLGSQGALHAAVAHRRWPVAGRR